MVQDEPAGKVIFDDQRLYISSFPVFISVPFRLVELISTSSWATKTTAIEPAFLAVTSGPGPEDGERFATLGELGVELSQSGTCTSELPEAVPGFQLGADRGELADANVVAGSFERVGSALQSAGVAFTGRSPLRFEWALS